jgi:hypothetical protein
MRPRTAFGTMLDLGMRITSEYDHGAALHPEHRRVKPACCGF